LSSITRKLTRSPTASWCVSSGFSPADEDPGALVAFAVALVEATDAVEPGEADGPDDRPSAPCAGPARIRARPRARDATSPCLRTRPRGLVLVSFKKNGRIG